MHKYRSHHCNQLSLRDIDAIVKLSGWIHRKRDHGNVLFIDLRDHYGITQLVFNDLPLISLVNEARVESVITIIGRVVAREHDHINDTIPTGKIEVLVQEFFLDSSANQLPFSVNLDQEIKEEIRLKYRFLDLRREKLHKNIILRSQVINEIRTLMLNQGFLEFQTPILTSSSPEGARDFLVPSRLHPKKFYALPQAPQQFKQLLMVSGFDKYFQIAPCFRDEDSRSDRSAEFYQLDVEMSFVEQEDVFAAIEPLMYKIFTKFSNKSVSPTPFVRIPYKEAICKYGSDKPDLRNPIIATDVTSIFKNTEFAIFRTGIAKGQLVKAMPVTNTSLLSRSFFDSMINFVIQEGGQGLTYIQFDNHGEAKGPIAKFFTKEQLYALQKIINIDINNHTIFFICDKLPIINKLVDKVRKKLGIELNLISSDKYEFCWITDFPFYEWNEQTNAIDFSHNPFSMPQGEMDALLCAKTTQDLLNIKAYQYDIVCNGFELSSGAIRNHKLDIMYKAFEIVGYTNQQVEEKFSGMVKAFQFGTPPHGGIAPGIDRIVMLLANEPNLREVVAFPLNQQAQDLLMNAPSDINEKQLKELHLLLLNNT